MADGMMIDTGAFAAVAAVVNIVATVGGGFYFMGRMTGRLDIQDVKIERIEKDVRDTKGLLVTAAVDASRLSRAENDIQSIETDVRNLRRGVGWVQDHGARAVDREY